MSKYAEESKAVCLLIFILPYHTTVAFYLFLSCEVRADLFNPNYWQRSLLTKNQKNKGAVTLTSTAPKLSDFEI